MASFSFANQLSFFFLFLVLLFSPQIQARDSKFFSLFTHFKTIYNVKDESLAPAPAPITEAEPAAAPENGETIPSGPAPEPEFFVKGEGYGLYGSDSSSQYSQTKETPKTSTFEDELLNEDFNDNKSYKTGYPQTNLYNYHNNEVYTTKNYNNEESKNTYNNEVYSKKYNSEEYKNNYNNEVYSNNFNDNNGKEYNNNNYYGNGYERKGDQGMSDTRFMENGKYYYNINGENENNYNLNGYESSERGSTENEGYYQKNQYPNEFDTMEEYEKQQQAQGYTP